MFILLRTLCRHRKSYLDWNQQLVDSFTKTPGVEVAVRRLRNKSDLISRWEGGKDLWVKLKNETETITLRLGLQLSSELAG
jgi:hypothetical protein